MASRIATQHRLKGDSVARREPGLSQKLYRHKPGIATVRRDGAQTVVEGYFETGLQSDCIGGIRYFCRICDRTDAGKHGLLYL